MKFLITLIFALSYDISALAYSDPSNSFTPLHASSSAQDGVVVNTVSIRVHLDLDSLYAYTVQPDTPGQILHERGPIPGIENYEILKGPWDHPKALRQFTFSDGSTSLEEIVSLDKPEFHYKVSAFSGSLSYLIDHIDGHWHFENEGSDTTVTWTYAVTPTNFLTEALVCFIAKKYILPFMVDGMQNLKFIADAKGSESRDKDDHSPSELTHP